MNQRRPDGTPHDPSTATEFFTFHTQDQPAWETVTMAREQRMPWLHKTCDAFNLTLWPAPLETTTTARSVVGPHGQHAMDLGFFIKAAADRGSDLCFATYGPDPGEDQDTAAIGDGLIMQILHRGVVLIWAGAPLPPGEDSTAAGSHPTPEQQRVIDELVDRLVTNPGYRALTRKGERDGFARTELPELAQATRSEHPVLPPNFVYRVLQTAGEKVDHLARHAYAGVDLEAVATGLTYDTELAAIGERTARRAFVRDTLLARFKFAPTAAVVAQVIDLVDRAR